MTAEQEEIVLDKSIELITQVTRQTSTGDVAPWWEFSKVTRRTAAEKGHQVRPQSDAQRLPSVLRPQGRHLDQIDYSQHPDTWMKPLVRGEETDLVEIPANWYLDDLPPMMFIKKAPNSHGFVNPRHLEEMWRDQFDSVYREHEHAGVHHDHPPRRVRPPASAVDA